MTQVPRKDEDSASPSAVAAADAPTKPPEKPDSSPPADKEDGCVDHGGAVAGEPMEEDPVGHTTAFCLRLNQPRSNLQHKMRVPELCRNFR